MMSSSNLQVKNKMLDTLGLAQKARKCIMGDELLNGISKNRVSLVLLANDASERTQKEIKTKASFKNIIVIDLFTKEELSNAVGKFNRVAIGITDDGFSKLFKNYIKDKR